MSTVFRVEHLPDVDQRLIKRGLCPWCVCCLYEEFENDTCPECGDVFVGKLTIED